MADKDLVVDIYPLAVCERFPNTWVTPRTRTWRVRLTPKGEIFSKGNTASQAWRRAYEKIIQQSGDVCPDCGAADAESEVKE